MKSIFAITELTTEEHTVFNASIFKWIIKEISALDPSNELEYPCIHL